MTANTSPIYEIYADFCTRITPYSTVNDINYVWGDPAWLFRMRGDGTEDAFGEPLKENIAQTVLWAHSQKRSRNATRWEYYDVSVAMYHPDQDELRARCMQVMAAYEVFKGTSSGALGLQLTTVYVQQLEVENKEVISSIACNPRLYKAVCTLHCSNVTP
jgi:hypothetical protein